MLTRLTVKNLALIEKLELEPCDRLNILSGETGAGKSIIVDGIMLLLGARYDKSLLRYGEAFGYVEGVFDSTEKSRAAMDELGIEDEETLIINRKFYVDGRNEIRINGRAATLNMLRGLTATLVDIYGQNEYQTLMKPAEHLRLIDYYVRADSTETVKAYTETYSEYRAVATELSRIGDVSQREREIDLLRYQIEEIDESHVYENEEEELVERRNIITSAEKIYAALGIVSELLNDREDGAASELVGSALREMGTIANIKNSYAEMYERLDTVAVEIGDISDGIADELDSLNFDMNELDEIEKRLGTVRALKRKYGAYTDMMKFRKTTAQRLEFLENADENYTFLTDKKNKLTDKLYALAKKWHDIREKGADEFSGKVKSELHELGMENADFTVRFSPFPDRETFEGAFNKSGVDSAEFYLSPNVGQPLKPLTKIISGGEMSRFMLALKVISNESDDIPTMIFDEIDAGISGITGRVVAKKLAVISRKHQILCVTHLAQIAAMADNHYYISKQTAEGSTVTVVSRLDECGMTDEISRLSGGQGISEESDMSARTMKKWSNDYKASLS